jgi:hypothetical protein
MMSRDRYFEAQEQLELIRYALANQHLSAQRRTELQQHELALSAVVTRPWLPVLRSRRWLVVLIFALGLQQAWAGHYLALLWWLLLPLFSPRLNAEISHRLAS